MDTTDLTAWVGRTETASDKAIPGPIQRLAALLDHERPPWRAGEVPPLAHWLFFLPHTVQSQIAEDGHPVRGSFLPPVMLRGRMWAGGRLTFHAPIPIGADIERRSEILDVTEKTGSSGPMVLVTICHEFFANGVHALSEEQDIVYREASAAPTPLPRRIAAPPEGDYVREFRPEIVQLFRFSALTFNAHRIHYDRDYARDVEGYPGLVLHGPFLAILLLDHFLRHRPRAQIRRFDFRARRPVFDLAPFNLCLNDRGHEAEAWVAGPDGETCMTSSLEATNDL
jgi:3-methylfumaryl-CoA hydratase